METNKNASYAVTFGNLEGGPWETHLETLFLETQDQVRQLAKEFIKVIPDDPDAYLEDVDSWDGQGQLLITHQEDDYFYFAANPIKTTTNLDNFNKFVASHV